MAIDCEDSKHVPTPPVSIRLKSIHPSATQEILSPWPAHTVSSPVCLGALLLLWVLRGIVPQTDFSLLALCCYQAVVALATLDEAAVLKACFSGVGLRVLSK